MYELGEEGGRLLEGVYFRELYISCYLGNTTVKEHASNILICCLGNRLYYAVGILLASNTTQSNHIMIMSEELLHLCT